jgi:two-component system, NtrC family, nitrogen regulation sensor histidine kinase NtrY
LRARVNSRWYRGLRSIAACLPWMLVWAAAICLLLMLYAKGWYRLGVLGGIVLVVALNLLQRYAQWHPLRTQLAALKAMVLTWKDQDFSTAIATPENAQLAALTSALNELGETLRRERGALAQRELLLDTVIQNTATAIVLLDANAHVVLDNLSARALINRGRPMQGLAWQALSADMPTALQQALTVDADSFCSLRMDGADEVFHLSQQRFTLQARAHQLIQLRRLTAELSRQELQVLKKVIRVMSHELNNSLAPISSMAHSGKMLLERGQTQPLAQVFSTIGERAKHLAEFIAGYGALAKLPTPVLANVALAPVFARVTSLVGVGHSGELDVSLCVLADVAQLEQLLINVLKNAKEAESAPELITLRAQRWVNPDGRTPMLSIEVLDRGSGMSESVLRQALMPFFSTKRSSGLGLALAREIVDAHGGSLSLSAREGGGAVVRVLLPSGCG